MDATDSNLDSLPSAWQLTLAEAQKVALCTYEELLLEINRSVNLTAARDQQTLRTEHTLDSLALVPIIRERLAAGGIEQPLLIDVGTGGGFPAIPLAIALDTLEVACIESIGKKARALTRLISAAGLQRVTVLNDRAERLARQPRWREAAVLATARAIGHLATVAELALPFLQRGGLLLAQKGPDPSQEIKEAQPAIAELGGHVAGIRRTEIGPSDPKRTVILIEKTDATPERYPRRPGLPAKRRLMVGKR